MRRPPGVVATRHCRIFKRLHTRHPHTAAHTRTLGVPQVLGVGTDTGCASASVLLFFDRRRVLFTAGEGFQRFATEHRVRLSRVDAVLLTRSTSSAAGGLPGAAACVQQLPQCRPLPRPARSGPRRRPLIPQPPHGCRRAGMLLTMADHSCGGLLAGHASLALHGPRGLGTLVDAFRTFVNVRDVGLRATEFGAAQPVGELAPVVQDDLVTITPVVLEAAAAAEPAGEPVAKRARIEGGAEAPAACYACELADVPGKFLPQKVRGCRPGGCFQRQRRARPCTRPRHAKVPRAAQAAALGVPRGPAYGKLVRGEEVTGANGRVVKPEEVMEPTVPGQRHSRLGRDPAGCAGEKAAAQADPVVALLGTCLPRHKWPVRRTRLQDSAITLLGQRSSTSPQCHDCPCCRPRCADCRLPQPKLCRRSRLVRGAPPLDARTQAGQA
jgi:hypothetical protein